VREHERNLLYATHTSTSEHGALPGRLIAVHDLRAHGVQRLRSSTAFSGLTMYLLCLPDRAQVGMAATFIDGRPVMAT
jgi:hypothetical protein